MRRLLFLFIAVLLQFAGFGQTIDRIEYFFDSDPGYGLANTVACIPGSSVTATFTLTTSGLSEGIHNLCVRAKDIQSRWSILSSDMFIVEDIEPGMAISKLEYYLDIDPGFGNAVPVTFVPGSKVSAAFPVNIPVNGPGMHYVCLRAMDVNERWSAVSYYPFVDLTSTVNPEITGIEYFIDTDPGFGSGVVVPVTPGEKVNVVFTPSTAALDAGTHFLCVRAKNQAGGWSTLKQYVFSKVQDTRLPVASMEYFFDTDPGFGSGYPINMDPGQSVVAQFSADTTGLLQGNRLLMVRAKDLAGNWSIVQDTIFNFTSLQRTWNGTISDDWNNAGNWSPEGVPGWNDDVLIPSSAPFMPFVRTHGLSCRKIAVTPGGELHILPGIVLTVNGDLRLD